MSRSRLTIGGALLACLLLSLTGAFYLLFAQMASYDDEGYVLMSIRQVLDGHVLYDQVYSQYGPFLYVWNCLVYIITGLPATQDVNRLLTLGLLGAGALAASCAVYRHTRHLILALIVQLAVVRWLLVLVDEPGHPAGLISFLLCLSVLTIPDSDNGFRRHWRWAVWGLLTIALFLTKVNVGLFFALAIVLLLLATMDVPGVSRIRLLAWGPAALPWLLVRVNLDKPWAWHLALVWTLALLPILYQLTTRTAVQRGLGLRQVASWLGAIVVGGTLTLAFVLCRGTSWRALYYCTVAQHFRFGNTFFLPLETTSYEIAFAFVAGAWGWWCVRNPSPRLLLGAKLVFHSLVVYSLVNLDVRLLLVSGVPLLWTTMVRGREEESPDSTLLGLFALFQVFQAYPVAATQRYTGSLLLLILAVWDWSRLAQEVVLMIGRPSLRREANLAFAGVFGCCVALTLVITWAGHALYAASQPLPFPGSTMLRVTPAEVQRYTRLTEAAQHRCDVLFGWPQIMMINIWSGVAPPDHANSSGSWSILFTAEQQARIQAALEQSSRACVLRAPHIEDYWTRKKPQDSALGRYIGQQFRETLQIDGYSLWERIPRVP